MNPVFYIKGFAWLAFVAICIILISNFWLPVLLGIGATVVMAILLPGRR